MDELRQTTERLAIQRLIAVYAQPGVLTVETSDSAMWTSMLASCAS